MFPCLDKMGSCILSITRAVASGLASDVFLFTVDCTDGNDGAKADRILDMVDEYNYCIL